MGMFVFGAGTGFSRVDKGGGLIVSRKIATMQGIDLKIDAPMKEMHGGLIYPEDVARGNAKISGTIKTGKFRLGAFNDMFLNGAKSSGHVVPIVDEAQAVDVTNQATVDNGAGGITDMGVELVLTAGGTRVTLERTLDVTPDPGLYHVNEATGEYTFNTAIGITYTAYISYRYTDTGGITIEMGNPVIGEQPTMELVMVHSRNVKGLVGILYRVVFNNLDLSSKQEDYMVPSLAFSAFADEDKASPGQFSYTDTD